MCVESPSGWLLSLELAPKPVTPHPLKIVNDTKMLHKVPLLDNILLLTLREYFRDHSPPDLLIRR